MTHWQISVVFNHTDELRGGTTGYSCALMLVNWSLKASFWNVWMTLSPCHRPFLLDAGKVQRSVDHVWWHSPWMVVAALLPVGETVKKTSTSGWEIRKKLKMTSSPDLLNISIWSCISSVLYYRLIHLPNHPLFKPNPHPMKVAWRCISLARMPAMCGCDTSMAW